MANKNTILELNDAYKILKSKEAYLERLAKNLTRLTNIRLNIVKNPASFTGPNQNGFHIQIGMTAYDKHDDAETTLVKGVGITAHEAAHIIWSDFNVVAQNQILAEQYRENIPVLAAKYDENASDADTLLANLENCMYQYVFNKYLADMLNSLEDGRIESLIPAEAPRVYGGIVATRNHVWSLEEKAIKDYLKNNPKEDDEKIIDSLITEIRAMCCIGYRKELKNTLLKKFLTKDDIKELNDLAIYARFCAESTAEINAIAEVCLEKLSPFIKIKVHKFFESYMNELKKCESGQLPPFPEMMTPPSEFSINGKMNGDMAGMNIPQPPASRFEMDLPESTMKKIANAMQKQKEQQQSQNASQGNQSSFQTPCEGQDGDNSENNQQNSTQNGTENEENQNNSNSSHDSNLNSKEKTGEKGNSQGASNSNNKENSSPSKEGKISAADSKQIAEEARKAEDALKGSVDKINKQIKSEEIEDLNHACDKSQGTAPIFTGDNGNQSLSDYHKDLKVNYTPAQAYSKKTNMGYYGAYVAHSLVELKRLSKSFSERLQEVLMYTAKSWMKKGLMRGRLNSAGLIRSQTDQKCFKKKIEGQENNARICLLIDESGSMSGEKLINAIKGSAMLLEACQRIHVPISIMGHSMITREAIELHHYVDFDNCFNKKAINNVLQIESSGCNHDGLAIFKSLCYLAANREDNEKLVFMIISDGAPNGAFGYNGESAYQDIQTICAKFKRQFDIETIAIGIGHDTEHIANIYSNYVLVPDVSALPNQLLQLLKKVLLK